MRGECRYPCAHRLCQNCERKENSPICWETLVVRRNGRSCWSRGVCAQGRRPTIPHRGGVWREWTRIWQKYRQQPNSPSVRSRSGVQLDRTRIVPRPAVLLEVLSQPAPNRQGVVQVRHERSPLARKAEHSESQQPQGSRGIWQDQLATRLRINKTAVNEFLT